MISSTCRRMARAGCLLALAFGMTTSSARAGTYVINNCNVPDKARAPSSPWFWEFAENASSSDDCAGGGGFGFYFGGPLVMPRGADAALTLITPPSGRITIRRVRLWLAARLDGTGSALFLGTNAGAADGQVTNAGIFSPPGGDTLNAPFVTPLLPPGTNVFRVLLYCSESSPSDCYPASRSVLEVLGAETTLLESTIPSVAFGGGTLFDPGAPAGQRSIQYVAEDDESGVERVDAIVDGAVAASADFASDCPHSSIAACAARRVAALTLDTTSLSSGTHSIRLRVRDAAGNSAESDSSRTFEVANASEPGTTPVKNYELAASFSGTTRRAIVVDYERRARLRGRLTTTDGTGVVGAAIVLLGTTSAKGDAKERIVARTDANGRFRFSLAPGGRSRTIRVGYRPDQAGALSAPPLTLKVRAAANLRVSLDGVRVRYRGRVRSRPIPRRGVLVIMQGRRKGGIWQPFAYRRVREQGTFSGTYRLRVHRPGVVLQFRAVVPRGSGYAYDAGRSPTVTRTVR